MIFSNICMPHLRAIIPTDAVELFTQETLLDLPNRRWAYIQGNMDAAGQLRPDYVMDAEGLRRFLGGRQTARHPINGSRSYRARNVQRIPQSVVAAYRALMAGGAGPSRPRSRSRTPSISPNTLRQIAEMDRHPRPRSVSPDTLLQIALMESKQQAKRKRR